jgi:aminopeptidase N
VEAANTFGSYYEKDNYSKSDYAYKTLAFCINNNNNNNKDKNMEEQTFTKLHPEVKQAIIRNIGKFERKESINLLESVLYKQNESYFVRASTATAIGKSLKDYEISSSSSDNAAKVRIITQLKDIVNLSYSFRNVITTGAIEGLKELSKDKNRDILVDIANFLIKATSSQNEYFKRLAATSALSKFVYPRKSNQLQELQEMNDKVFTRLLELLSDSRRKVKINACKAFTDDDAKLPVPNATIFKAIEALIYVAEHDVDGVVRREAERCANILREWINEWSSKPLIMDIKLREAYH